jgi:hypothetical protein
MFSRPTTKDQTHDGLPQLETLTLFPFMPHAAWYTEYWFEVETRGNFIPTFPGRLVLAIARFPRPRSAWKKATLEGEDMRSTPLKPSLEATP